MINELHPVTAPMAEEPFNIGRGAVAEADPDDLRWGALQQAQALKVLILRHEDEPVGSGVGPNGSVSRGRQADVHDVA